MENKKLTLEDLKLESFLTEIDNSKLIKVQGGNGAYGDSEGEGCGSEIDDCDTGQGQLTVDFGCIEITEGQDCVPETELQDCSPETEVCPTEAQGCTG